MAKQDRTFIGLQSSHLIVFAVICMLTVLVYVWFHLDVTRLNYRIAGEMDRQNRLLEETRRLKIEIATLRSPHRIEATAREKLGMEYPGKEQVRFIK